MSMSSALCVLIFLDAIDHSIVPQAIQSLWTWRHLASALLLCSGRFKTQPLNHSFVVTDVLAFPSSSWGTQIMAISSVRFRPPSAHYADALEIIDLRLSDLCRLLFSRFSSCRHEFEYLTTLLSSTSEH